MKTDQFHDIASGIIQFRQDLITQSLKHGADIDAAFQCFGNDMRRVENALIERGIADQAGADLLPDARRRKAVRRSFNQVFSADQISSGRRDGAAGVFDQRTGNQIGTDFNGFSVFTKFTVAVIDKYGNFGIYLTDNMDQFFDFIDGQCIAEAVALGSLNIKDFGVFFNG